MAVTWMKQKYTRGKTVGYKSKHNDGTRRKLKRKVSDAMKIRIKESQPNIVLVVNAKGKRRFTRV